MEKPIPNGQYISNPKRELIHIKPTFIDSKITWESFYIQNEIGVLDYLSGLASEYY